MKRSVIFFGALAAFAVVGSFSATGCGTSPTCDAVCSNVLDKCTTDGNELARNQCLEECAQRSQSVPDSCGSERDAVLECLAGADSLDCSDPQRSAACADVNETLSTCASSEATGSSGTGSSGMTCDRDDECASDLCNTASGMCATPAELGAKCYRDDECASDVCNTVTEMCATPAELGAKCYRDDECVSDLCNTATGVCATPGAAGGACYRDGECASDQCNQDTETCL